MHSGICGAALLSLIFFTTDAHAANAEPNRPANAEQGQTPLATQAQTHTPALLPAKPTARAPEASAVLPQTLPPSKPAPARHSDANATLASLPASHSPRLPASKRLAISLGAGMLTLIAALWIGARRD